MIKGLLFDLDGTVFDSHEANINAYSLAFKEAGVNFNVERYKELFGHRFNEMMDAIAPSVSEELRLKIKQDKSKYYKDNLELVKPNTGLLDFIEDAKRNYVTALVTTASQHNVDSLLEYFLPNKELFNVVIAGEDVKKSKPDPECYILAAAALNIKPEECLVFEDSEIGIKAAKSAGMSIIKVTL